jgi:hypothetical protein
MALLLGFTPLLLTASCVATTPSLTSKLHPTGPGIVQGYVSDIDGMRRAHVSVVIELAEEPFTVVQRTMTNEDGEFVVTGLPAKALKLTASSGEGLEGTTEKVKVVNSTPIEVYLNIDTLDPLPSIASRHREQWEIKYEATQLREQKENQQTLTAVPHSDVVIAAEVVRHNPSQTPSLVVELRVQHVLKGWMESSQVLVHMLKPIEPADDSTTTRSWFLRRRPDGEFDEIKRAPSRANFFFDKFVQKTDLSPFPGMETPSSKEFVLLELGSENGLGQASMQPSGSTDLGDLRLVGQIRNFGPLITVTPPLYGSAYGWRSPYLSLQLEDAEGNKVQPERFGLCGNMDGLFEDDFVDLAPGQALRFFLQHESFGYRHLPPGVYRARLSMTFRRTLKGVEYRVSRATRQRLSSLWEGTLISNWLQFSIAPSKASVQRVEGTPPSPSTGGSPNLR